MSEEKKALLEKIKRMRAMLDAAEKLNIKGLGKGKSKGKGRRG